MSRQKMTTNIVLEEWSKIYWEFIEDKDIYWLYISKNPNITWDIIIKISNTMVYLYISQSN
jgi:hypothetical protein